MRRIVALVALIVAACGDSSEPAAGGEQTVTVFAAGSLTEAFEEIGDSYEKANPNVSVRFNFLASSDLATQIEEGAGANVFASADEPNMQRLIDGDFVESDPQVFAHNRLAIVVPADNPGGVENLQDLEEDDLVVSLCVEECPAGRYAREVFAKSGIEVEPDSLEPEVKGVVTRVEVGEADAGIVYTTDVLAAGDDVAGVDIPDAQNVIATYPIATLRGSPSPATDFVDFVLSDEGQRILARYGFLTR